MLTIVKTSISHTCDNCHPGHRDFNREQFSTFLEAQEVMRVGISMALELGFEVIDAKPDLVELERVEDDQHNELEIKLMVDMVGAN